MTCPFCAIVDGDSAHVVFNDDNVLAFLDIQPLVTSQAHVLVIPKKHCETLDELADDEQTAAALGKALPKIAKAVLKATGGSAFNIVQNNGETAGQVVPHVHFHIVVRDPRNKETGDVSVTVEKLKGQYTPLERVRYSMQVFSKGQREDLSSSAAELEKSIKHHLAAASASTSNL